MKSLWDHNWVTYVDILILLLTSCVIDKNIISYCKKEYLDNCHKMITSTLLLLLS